MNRFSTPHRGRRQGAALIITLFFLVIISIIIFGFLDTTRMDRGTANSHFERMRANTLARAGIEATIATLQRETGDPPPNSFNPNYFPRNWISQPGALVVTNPDPKNTDRTRLVKQAPLHSGAPVTNFATSNPDDWVLQPPDLNVKLLADPTTHLLLDAFKKTTDENGKDTEKPIDVPMRVRWIYQRKDGTLDLDATTGEAIERPVLTDTANPIVGRYAYWADDESAKVNYNLAWRNDSSNTRQVGNQTKVDLSGLDGGNTGIADQLHKFVTGDNFATVNRFFNTPFDARQINNAPIAFLNRNKFNLTHYNSDPDTTYYGRSRMVLTTQLSNAVVRNAEGNIMTVDDQQVSPTNPPVIRPFLDILKNPKYSTAYLDPGLTANIDPDKINTVVNNLINNYLKRSDWPMVDGTHSIQDKYYSNYLPADRDRRLAQVALNIIDYVRCAESPRLVVQPIRAIWDPSGIFVPDFNTKGITVIGAKDAFKGLVRGPYITEVGMWVSDTAQPVGIKADLYYRTVGYVEVYLPENYGIERLDLMKNLNYPGEATKKWTTYFGEFYRQARIKATDATDSPLYVDANGNDIPNGKEFVVVNPRAPTTYQAYVKEAAGETVIAVVNSTNSKTKLPKGQYRTFAIEVFRKLPKTSLSTAQLRCAITLEGGGRIDVVPLEGSLDYTIDPGLKAENEITTLQTNDPRVNGLKIDWTRLPQTLGAVNKSWAAEKLPPSGTNPPQDTNSDGTLSSASFQMPYPAGDLFRTPGTPPHNPNGRVNSAGELGFIHTGVEGSEAAKVAGVPWRSLRLQPSGKQGSSVVPDWAFMDLFTVPIDVMPTSSATMFSPHGNSTGGRVNINAKPQPFDVDIQRYAPLAAALTGLHRSSLPGSTDTVNAGDALLLAKDIYNHDANSLAAGANRQDFPNLPPGGGGLRYYECPGEVAEIKGVADRGENSEQLLSELINLISVRGNVFSVYTVGQALKQTPAGKLVITAEQRQQAMVERYITTKNSPQTDDDEVRFRTIYSRNLSP